MPDLFKIVWPDASETLQLTAEKVGELVTDALNLDRENRPNLFVIMPYTE